MTPRAGSPLATPHKQPCRLCGTPTGSRYGICLAHSDLRAALDQADAIELGSLAMDAGQAARETEAR